jgi:hypothetical protein
MDKISTHRKSSERQIELDIPEPLIANVTQVLSQIRSRSMIRCDKSMALQSMGTERAIYVLELRVISSELYHTMC